MNKQFNDIFDECVTIADWQDAIKAVLEKAKGGDTRAFETLANRRFGVPKQEVSLENKKGQIKLPFEKITVKIHK